MTVYVATLQCLDRPGIVLATSTAIIDVDGNILENDQYTDPVTSQFCMRTRFEAASDDLEGVRERLEVALAPFVPDFTIRREETRRRALVMVSQYDHCLSELLYRRDSGDLPLDIVAVVSNHRNCAALAARHDVPFFHIPVRPDNKIVAEDELRELLATWRVDFVILARYMQVLSEALCDDLAGRAVNIHHSFLPGFKGARPYHQAYERGVKLIGATAHYVTAELDEGPIIDQDVVRVTHARRPEDLVALGRDVERSVLARAAHLLAEDRVALVGHRTVVFAQ
ncbi:MAG: formyltetrahydrofolate deformylase [Acidobacteria bacterium]|nr:formyltetrahydrofolate deformylase [Acidobacteriota bacterium]